MAVFLCPTSAIFQWFTDAGILLAGGKINTYIAGSSTPTNTWTDQTGTVLNSNPVVLAANGRMNNVQIWQAQGVALKVIVTDSNNNQLGPVFDQVTGINDPSTVQALYANPASGFGADLIANVSRSYDLISSVRAAPAPTLAAGQTLVINVEFASTPGDSLGGQFYWDAASVLADDGVNVIKPTAVSAGGRFIRFSRQILLSKRSATPRTTTTVTNDPDLTVSLYAGLYLFELRVTFFAAGAGTQGIKYGLNFSGGFSTGSAGIGRGSANAAFVDVNAPIVNAPASVTLSHATISTVADADQMIFKGTVLVTSLGTFALSWAQNSASANSTSMGFGSYLLITRLN